VPENLLTRAKFPCVDVHLHPGIRLRHSSEMLDDYVRVMDEQNIAVCVSLDGGLGDELDEHMRYLWTKHRERFVIFANIDWRGSGREDDPGSWDMHRPDFARRTAMALEAAKAKGISGLKLFKQFGLGHRNPDGSLVKIDDSRWDEIWQACGRLELVVLMHTADPSAFFQPIDETNERWEELHRHPEWSFHEPQWPSRDELLRARNRVIAKHRGTTFIAAHMANDAEDLAQAAAWLDEHPNLVVEIAARIAELGRQPYTAREFFIQYADRILFGTDGPRDPRRIHLHWRLLETYDEYFPYAENDFPPQGFWRIYGLGLPEDVLRKVYHENAARLIPGVRERLESALPKAGG
jgi:predicted TIM-barrel fold metal-dependent hydrolase